MKNASKYAEAVRTLYKAVAATDAERPSLDPLRAVVLGVLREGVADAAADVAMARFDEEFVDINELRVATELELADLMGEDYPDVDARSVRLREVLMALFDGEGRLSLDRIAALHKKEQRAALRAVPHATPFVEAHAMLLGFGGSALPLDGRTLAHLIEKEACDPEADLETAQKFLEQHLRVDEYWPFYAGTRRELAGAAGVAEKGADRAKSRKTRAKS